jgi:hypothetical protein
VGDGLLREVRLRDLPALAVTDRGGDHARITSVSSRLIAGLRSANSVRSRVEVRHKISNLRAGDNSELREVLGNVASFEVEELFRHSRQS